MLQNCFKKTRGDIKISQHCPAIKNNGECCKAWAGADGYCVGHSLDYQEARRKGGAARSNSSRAAKLMPARLRPIADILEKAIREVNEGKLDPRRATAMAALTSALVKVVTTGEMEERLRDLEARARK